MVVPCHFHAPSHSYKYEASDTLPGTNKKHYKNYSKEKKTLQKQKDTQNSAETKQNKTKKGEKETGKIWRYAAHKPTKGYQHYHK